MSGFDDDDDPILFEVDGGAVEDVKELYTGGGFSHEGMFHFECVKVEDKTEPDEEESGMSQVPSVNLHLQCLEGTVKSEIDKLAFFKLKLARYDKELDAITPLDERGQKNVRVIAYSFGLITAEELSKPNIKINLRKLVGRQSVAKVSFEDKREFTDKRTKEKKTIAASYKIRWPNDFYRLDDEAVKDVPKDMNAYGMMLQATGQSAGDVSGGGFDDLIGDL